MDKQQVTVIPSADVIANYINIDGLIQREMTLKRYSS